MKPLLFQHILQLAQSVGLDAVGVAPAACLEKDADFMEQWISQGLHGNLDYLERNRSLRYDVRRLVPGAKTVVVVLLTYAHSGHDYHRAIKSKLYQMEALSGITPLNGQHIFCDSTPFLERRYAVLAGLGQIGRNHQLIHPVLGSKVHIGEWVIGEQVEQAVTSTPAEPLCGNCNRCVAACPGQALGHEWDVTRCVAYVTHKCTVCQDVCPFNHNDNK